MKTEQLKSVADQVFGAFEALDEDAIRRLSGPDARFWSTTMPEEATVDTLVGPFATMRENLGTLSYENARRLYVAPDTVIELHDVRASGAELKIGACVVVKLDENGLIQRFSDYVGKAG